MRSLIGTINELILYYMKIMQNIWYTSLGLTSKCPSWGMPTLCQHVLIRWKKFAGPWPRGVSDHRLCFNNCFNTFSFNLFFAFQQSTILKGRQTQKTAMIKFFPFQISAKKQTLFPKMDSEITDSRKRTQKWTQKWTPVVVSCPDSCFLFRKRAREAASQGASGLADSH